MLLTGTLLIVGFFLVLWGADKFTDGATDLARKWGVSEIVIGLTIVSLGTSLPEFIVSFMSLLKGSSDMSLGNVMGSNLFNALFIIGFSVMFGSIKVEKSTAFFDLPMCVFMSFLLFVLIYFDNRLSRIDAFILFAMLVLYLYALYRKSNHDRAEILSGGAPRDLSFVDKPLWKICLVLLFGCLFLILGGQLMVKNAVDIAQFYDVPVSIIGLTILAIGTSLPELATSVVSARKGQHGIALGNIVGSNILNIGFILGGCGLIRPMGLSAINRADWVAFLASALLIWLFGYTAFLEKRRNFGR